MPFDGFGSPWQFGFDYSYVFFLISESLFLFVAIDHGCDVPFPLTSSSSSETQNGAPLSLDMANAVTQENGTGASSNEVNDVAISEVEKTTAEVCGISYICSINEDNFAGSRTSSSSTESLVSAEDSDPTLQSPIIGPLNSFPSENCSVFQAKPSIVTRQPDGSQQIRTDDSLPNIYREDEDQERYQKTNNTVCL